MKKLSEIRGSRLGALLRSILICVVTLLILFALLWTGIIPDQYDIDVGQPASITVYATKDVEDTVTTELMRQAAADAVEPSYRSADHSVNASVLEKLENDLQKLLDLREEFAAQGGEINEETLSAFNLRSPAELTQDMLSGLLAADSDALQTLSADCVNEVRETLNSTLPEGQENAAVTRISRDLIDDNYPIGAVNACVEVIRACIQPNMLIDTDITEENRQKAREAVEPEVLVKREVIVREGEIVTEAQYQMIASLGLLKSDKLDLQLFGGLALLVLALCAVIYIYLRQFSPSVLNDSRRLLLLCVILVLEVAISLLVRGMNSYLMPVALGAILISTLIDTKTAMFVNAVLSIIVSMLVSADGLFSMQMFAILLMAFASGPVASLVRAAHWCAARGLRRGDQQLPARAGRGAGRQRQHARRPQERLLGGGRRRVQRGAGGGTAVADGVDLQPRHQRQAHRALQPQPAAAAQASDGGAGHLPPLDHRG